MTAPVQCDAVSLRRVSDLKDRMRDDTGSHAAFEGMWRQVKAAVGAKHWASRNVA